MKTICVVFLAAFLAGCGSKAIKPIEIYARPVERTPLAIELPPPLEVESPQWFVVTPGNAASTWTRLRDLKLDPVIIGLSEQGYEQLAISLAEARARIQLQSDIIQQYINYYEPSKTVAK